jgi:hypothetical protein
MIGLIPQYVFKPQTTNKKQKITMATVQKLTIKQISAHPPLKEAC